MREQARIRPSVECMLVVQVWSEGVEQTCGTIEVAEI